MALPAEILRECWFLAGPTASGKTALSIRLAENLNAEIISLDSMAIYRGMDIGTAKPKIDERHGIAHHLIDVADPHQEFSVAEFSAMAEDAAQDISSRGKSVLFVGGTGLYLRTMLRGLFDGPEADWDFRKHMTERAVELGPDWLHAQLAAVDAATATRLHPNDMRRIIRALEVHRVTGLPLSQQQTQAVRPTEDQPRAVIWISPPRGWLYQRIENRVDQMMEEGLLDETHRLLSLVPPPGRTALQALGYRELVAHLQGECSLGEAVKQIKTGTRQFAKRQHTWFRNLSETRPLEIEGTESPDQLLEKALEIARS